jgi:hypothetical protein
MQSRLLDGLGEVVEIPLERINWNYQSDLVLPLVLPPGSKQAGLITCNPEAILEQPSGYE